MFTPGGGAYKKTGGLESRRCAFRAKRVFYAERTLRVEARKTDMRLRTGQSRRDSVRVMTHDRSEESEEGEQSRSDIRGVRPEAQLPAFICMDGTRTDSTH